MGQKKGLLYWVSSIALMICMFKILPQIIERVSSFWYKRLNHKKNVLSEEWDFETEEREDEEDEL